MANEDWVQTAKLRFVHRVIESQPAKLSAVTKLILQQWFAADVPGYMKNHAEGEWRDVPVEEETAP